MTCAQPRYRRKSRRSAANHRDQREYPSGRGVALDAFRVDAASSLASLRCATQRAVSCLSRFCTRAMRRRDMRSDQTMAFRRIQ